MQDWSADERQRNGSGPASRPRTPLMSDRTTPSADPLAHPADDEALDDLADDFKWLDVELDSVAVAPARISDDRTKSPVDLAAAAPRAPHLASARTLVPAAPRPTQTAEQPAVTWGRTDVRRAIDRLRAAVLETVGSHRRRNLLVGTAVVAVLAAAAGIFVWVRASDSKGAASGAVTPTATMTITSNDSAAAVRIDDVDRGTAPLSLSIAPGEHRVKVSAAGITRELRVKVAAGQVVAQHVEFAAPEQPKGGRLQINSEPAGAEVAVDNQPRGTTPVTLTNVTAGTHTVTVGSGAGAMKRVVTVERGETAALVVALNSARAESGLVAINAPFDLQVSERGKPLGSTAKGLMLPAGRHDLELVSSAFEFRTTLPVTVVAGKTIAPSVPLPNGAVSINARPWAKVTIDGQDVGVTPIGNLAVPIGPHEIVWTHPQLGEKRRNVQVTVRTPVRVGVDMSQ